MLVEKFPGELWVTVEVKFRPVQVQAIHLTLRLNEIKLPHTCYTSVDL